MNVRVKHNETPPQSFEVNLKKQPHQNPIPGLYRSQRDGVIILVSKYDSEFATYKVATYTGIALADYKQKPLGYFSAWIAAAFTILDDVVEIQSTNLGGNYPQLAEDSREGVYLVLESDRAVLIQRGRESRVWPYYGGLQPSVGEEIEGDLSHLRTFTGTVQLSN